MWARKTQDPEKTYLSFFQQMEAFRGLESNVLAAEAFIHYKSKNRQRPGKNVALATGIGKLPDKANFSKVINCEKVHLNNFSAKASIGPFLFGSFISCCFIIKPHGVKASKIDIQHLPKSVFCNGRNTKISFLIFIAFANSYR